MDDEIDGIKEDLKRIADEEGDVLCRAALRRIEALEGGLAMAVSGLDWIGRRSMIIEAGAPSLRLHARMILANLAAFKET